MKHLFLCSAILWAFTNTFAQNIITGSVSDKETGEAIPYTTIYNLNDSTVTHTDLLGNFKIEAKENKDLLRIVSAGYKTDTLLAVDKIIAKLNYVTISLDEVVISSNREQEKRTETPIAITVISTETIEENKPTTIDQVLNQTPGVNMVDLGNEQHTMSIRRPIDYGASYLYMEDGIPIRASGVFNHNALLEINMANTSKIEIIRGPASSMYGSEAIGGAVNFISKRPSNMLTAGASVQVNNIGYKRTDFYVSNTLKEKLGLRVSGYYANQKDGVIQHSDFNKLALSLQASYLLSKKAQLVWKNTMVDYYSDMTGSLDSTAFYAKNYESNQTFTNRKVTAYRTSLALNKDWSNTSKTTLTGYFRTNSVEQNPSYRVKDDYIPWTQTGDLNIAHGELNDNSFKSYGLITQQKKEFYWLNTSLVAGGSFDYSPNTYNANYISINKNDEGIYDSFTETDSLLADYVANLTNVAFYTQVKIQPIKGLNVIGAIRYDLFHYAFDNNLDSNAYTSVLDGENSFSRFTPKIGITYDLKKNKGLYANYSQGFVPPQVGELYRGFDIPVLKPVYYDNYELGGWVTFAKEKTKLDVSIYKMDGQNEIISILQDDGSSESQNAGKTTHQGIEYGLTVHPHKDVKLRISGTNAIHKFVDFKESGTDYTGLKMPRAPQWLANAQITYKPSYLKGFRISMEWQHVDEYFMDQLNTKTYDGYDILNLRLGYEWKSLSTWVNVINLTNQLYSTAASASSWGESYSLGKPRNYTLGIAYKFQKEDKK